MQVTKLRQMIHGGDYNPDQWLDRPDILEKDIELMKKAGCNAMSVGIFAWAALEPEEGVFHFEWLDTVIDNLYANGIYTVLATPSGARPAWMAQKYPEVLRVNENGVRNHFGARHNHCYTSPEYRRLVAAMNTELAKRYAQHPAVILWHISNEYGGECHCPLCTEAFVEWLKERYDNDLDMLNRSWWSAFWSHTYTSWSQIESPLHIGETGVHGLTIDWKRFVTHQTVDFMKHEVTPLRAANPDIPVTTNIMGYYEGLNYGKFKDICDVISWDNYPLWHSRNDAELSDTISAAHDLMRSLKPGKPWLLMESTPSVTNWQPISKLKRPGMHMLSSMHAIAHGSDSVQYFQWRKSRGSSEKLHGAVVDHFGEADTRVFNDVAEVGERLKSLSEIVGTSFVSKAAIIFDTENRWIIKDKKGPRNQDPGVTEEMLLHYSALRKLGINIDLVDMESDFSSYKLVVAPMLYMFRAGIEKKLRDFVENGGTLVMTYESGIADEYDLCYLGGVPGAGMSEVLGLRSEEIDALYDHDSNHGVYKGKTYKITKYCDLIHATTAKVLSTYGSDFYKGRPCVTVNDFGMGQAYYICARFEKDFYGDFYRRIAKELGIIPLSVYVEDDVRYTIRTATSPDSDIPKEYFFFMNFSPEGKIMQLPFDMIDLETGKISDTLSMFGYGVHILTRVSE